MEHLALIRLVLGKVHIPVIAGGHIESLEDMKTLLDLGCAKVFLNMSKSSNVELLPYASQRFGKEHIAVCVNNFSFAEEESRKYADLLDTVLLLGDNRHLYDAVRNVALSCIPLMDLIDYQKVSVLLQQKNVAGISGNVISNMTVDLFELKDQLQAQGLPVFQQESAIPWSQFKLNSDGLIPVVVQDYKNHEVLMLAYMNEESFEKTVKTGRMTYWSRSRQELWTKGETSGHYQYVKRLSIDCDNDTLLAYVSQVGAACHTGHRSCFYRDLLKKEYTLIDPADSLKRLYDRMTDAKPTVSKDIAKEQVMHQLEYLTQKMCRYQISWDEVAEELDRNEE